MKAHSRFCARFVQRSIRAKTLRSRVYEYYAPKVGSFAPPVQLEVRRR